jgi:hypothetical protein
MYDFTNKAIRFETWEQGLHLAELANAQGMPVELSKKAFERYDRDVFCLSDDNNTWVNDVEAAPDETFISYSEFIESASAIPPPLTC